MMNVLQYGDKLMLRDSNPALLPFQQLIRPCKGFNSAYSLRCATNTPRNLSYTIAVMHEQSCTILKHTVQRAPF